LGAVVNFLHQPEDLGEGCRSTDQAGTRKKGSNKLPVAVKHKSPVEVRGLKNWSESKKKRIKKGVVSTKLTAQKK